MFTNTTSIVLFSLITK